MPIHPPFRGYFRWHWAGKERQGKHAHGPTPGSNHALVSTSCVTGASNLMSLRRQDADRRGDRHPPCQTVVKGLKLLPWHRGRSRGTLLSGQGRAWHRVSRKHHPQQWKAQLACAHGKKYTENSFVTFHLVYVGKAGHSPPQVWESTFPQTHHGDIHILFRPLPSSNSQGDVEKRKCARCQPAEAEWPILWASVAAPHPPAHPRSLQAPGLWWTGTVQGAGQTHSSLF